jgi:hypothetical protein
MVRACHCNNFRGLIDSTVIELQITYLCRLAGAAIATVGGLYFAVNPQRKSDGANDAPSGNRPETASQNGKSNEKMGQTKIERKDDPSQPGAGRPDPGEEAGLVGHGAKESPKSMEPGAASPDVSDKVRTKCMLLSIFSNAK